MCAHTHMRYKAETNSSPKDQHTNSEAAPQQHKDCCVSPGRLLHKLMWTEFSNSAQETGREAERQIWLASQRKGCYQTRSLPLRGWPGEGFQAESFGEC